MIDLAASHGVSILDPLGLFHKDKDARSTSKAQSLGTNFNLGPLSFTSSLASSSASATANGGGTASANAKANSQAYGGANANAEASALANAQGIYHEKLNSGMMMFAKWREMAEIW